MRARRKAMVAAAAVALTLGAIALALAVVLRDGDEARLVLRLDPRDPGSLQTVLTRAYADGARRVRIPPGTHRVRNPIDLRGVDDLDVDARGATLAMADSARTGLYVAGSRRFTLRGATLVNEVQPNGQGRIVAVGADRLSVELETEPGYPDLAAPDQVRATSAYLFDDDTRELTRPTSDLELGGMARRAEGRYGVRLAEPLPAGAGGGDWLAFRSARPAVLVHLDDTEAATLENVGLSNSSGLTVYETSGRANRYLGVSVLRAGAPRAAREAPLLSSAADALHSSGAEVGPVIENARFEYMGDDGIAIHGRYAEVVSITGQRLVVRAESRPLAPGHRVEAVGDDGAPTGGAIVQAVRPGAPGEWEADLDRPLATAAGARVTDADAVGNGFVVRDSTIRAHRARGLLVKAGGTIEGTTVDGSSMAGIVAGPEFRYQESGYVRDLVIARNTIRDTGYGTSRDAQLGAISIRGEGSSPDALGNTQVRIEDNVIQGAFGIGISLDGVADSVVRGNRLSALAPLPAALAARASGVGGALLLERTLRISFAGNEVRGGPVPAVVAGPLARESAGLPGGVRETP